jgi:hypothetical protein
VALSTPRFAFGSQQGWIDPAKDIMKGGSLEWFTVQHWMAARDGDVTVGIVPIDAPLASFGDINRGNWPKTFVPRSGTIFSYVMNNYWDTNYRAGQSGTFKFRYALTSSANLDASKLTRLGLDEMRPSEVNYVVSQDKVGDPDRPLPAAGTGFVKMSSNHVALITWKQSEDGNGTILRLAETAGEGTEATVTLPRFDIESAHLCSGVEENTATLPVNGNTVRLSFRPFEVLTLRVSSR